nr:immunoglobulin heavy chain junction region [Macaca mulatta]
CARADCSGGVCYFDSW